MKAVLVRALSPGEESWVEAQCERFPFILGRDQKCDFPLKDNGCSRSHARIESERGEYWLVDHGSRNGTLNDMGRRVSRVKITEENAVFQMGDTRVQVVLFEVPDVAPEIEEETLIREAPATARAMVGPVFEPPEPQSGPTPPGFVRSGDAFVVTSAADFESWIDNIAAPYLAVLTTLGLGVVSYFGESLLPVALPSLLRSMAYLALAVAHAMVLGAVTWFLSRAVRRNAPFLPLARAYYALVAAFFAVINLPAAAGALWPAGDTAELALKISLGALLALGLVVCLQVLWILDRPWPRVALLIAGAVLFVQFGELPRYPLSSGGVASSLSAADRRPAGPAPTSQLLRELDRSFESLRPKGRTK